jgi:hypothetical protein
MTPKEVLNALDPLVRTRARLKGEIVQKHELNHSTTCFLSILEAAERFPKELVKANDYKLIE